MLSDLSRYEYNAIHRKTESLDDFARGMVGIKLRSYQLEAANAIIKSVFKRDGKSFVIIFSRQSGKDELLANLILFIMARLGNIGGNIVCTQPTFKPQTINAMDRLMARSKQRPFFAGTIRRSSGYIFSFLNSRTYYFSSDPSANVVGATADRLLIVNEAQDIEPSVYDKRFAPMAASGNATRVFSGTSWTSDTLLERERKFAMSQQTKRDRRVFIVDAEQVGKINKWYGKFVQSEVNKLGRQHPLIKTQFYNELVDAQASMFNPTRRALMQGDQPAREQPENGKLYAFCIDVAGMDEALLNLDGMGNPGRDSTTLSIIEVDLSMLDTLQGPIYHVVKRLAWTGVSHMQIFGQLASAVAVWNPQYIVMDATGVGEGLWAMMAKAHPTRTIPVKFTQQEKSEVGWRFIAIVETGRFRDCCMTDEVRQQYDKCQSEILPGPQKTLRWGVKDGVRGADGELIHDDIVLADALVAKLDELAWAFSSPTLMTDAIDPLDEMKGRY